MWTNFEGLPLRTYWKDAPLGQPLYYVHHYGNPITPLEKHIFAIFKAQEGNEAPVSMVPLAAVDESKGIIAHSVPNTILSSILLRWWEESDPRQLMPLLLQEVYRKRFISYARDFSDFYRVMFESPMEVDKVFLDEGKGNLLPMSFGQLRVKAPGDTATLNDLALEAGKTFDKFVNAHWIPKMIAGVSVNTPFIVKLGSRFRVLSRVDSVQEYPIYLASVVKDHEPGELTHFYSLTIGSSKNIELTGAQGTTDPVFTLGQGHIITVRYFRYGTLLRDLALAMNVKKKAEVVTEMRRQLRFCPAEMYRLKKLLVKGQGLMNGIIIDKDGKTHVRLAKGSTHDTTKLTKHQIHRLTIAEGQRAEKELVDFLGDATQPLELGLAQKELLGHRYNPSLQSENPSLMASLIEASESFGIKMQDV